jgi:aspartyl-tRNA(Asn)/glutamyl-tRNA(Gln) amidotransferase subunit A
LTIADAAALIERRKLSPIALTQACLERIESVEGRINAFITVLRDEALQAAERAEAEIAAGNCRGPLHGIPIGVKDLYDTAGIPTTAGSKIYSLRMPLADAAAVERLKAAGAIIIGKLNLHELAYGVTNAISHYGATHNPWDTNRILAGSSGGSAAAVAAGECLGALGTDTAASIRLPVALCGIVGLKPTYDLVSRRGVIPLAWSLDHYGPMAHTVRGVALMLGVLAETPSDYATDLEGGVDGMRIRVPRHYFREETEPDVLNAFERAMQTFAELGASVQEIEIESLRYVHASLAAILATEATNYHLLLLHQNADDYSTGGRIRLESGLLYTASHYLQAQRVRTIMIEEMRGALEVVDLLATPTAPFTALEIAGADLLPAARLLNWYTRPFNLTGFPAISVPCGFDGRGLPIGLQLVGRPFEEATVLRAAYAYEQRSGWYKRRPSL